MFAWSSVCGARPAVMGIVNVTPDSFSDGGRFLDPDAAVAHGLALVAAGADLLDVGGESTRPGAEPVGRRRGARRVLPVVERLAAEAGVPVSIDTTQGRGRRRRARRRRDDRERRLRRARRPRRCSASWPRRGAGLVVMHMQGEPRTMQDDAALRRRRRRGRRASSSSAVDAARAAGIAADALVRRPRHRLRQDRGAQPRRCWRGSDELVARVDVPVLVGHVAEDVPRTLLARATTRPARRRRARRRHARHGRVGGRPRRRGSCGCTTSRRGAHARAPARA